MLLESSELQRHAGYNLEDPAEQTQGRRDSEMSYPGLDRRLMVMLNGLIQKDEHLAAIWRIQIKQAVRVATRYAPPSLSLWAPHRLARRRADAT